MFIGQKIKELRQQQNMTLSELAQKSGVQIATLSRIEHLKMIGTLESHAKIAKAFGIDVTQLYTNIITQEQKVELKNPKVTTDIFVHSEKSSYEILTSKVLNKRMMPLLLKIEADGKTNKEQNSAGTEKFIFVIEGKIEVHVGDKVYPLSKGHSLYFDASMEHWLVNAGKAVAKAVVVVTPVAL